LIFGTDVPALVVAVLSAGAQAASGGLQELAAAKLLQLAGRH
jgi:hypothetical protein